MSLAQPQITTLIPRHSRSEPVLPSMAGIVDNGSLLDSSVLLRGEREVLIRHGGETYRLRHTRNDKLILTK